MKKLLVSLDYMKTETVGGICRYLQEVLPRLQEGNSFDLSTFTVGDPPHPMHGLPKEIENHVLPVSWRRWRLWFTLAPRLASLRFRLPEHDLLWLPVPTTPGPRARNASIILTVHDIGPVARPQYYSLAVRVLWRRYLTSQLKLADFFITPSEFTKHEMVRYLGTPANAIAVIPHGSPISSNLLDESEGPPPKGSDDFTLLYVGPLTKKKGSDILIKAFDLLRQSSLSPDNTRLVIVGGVAGLDRSVVEMLESLKGRGRIVQTSRISFDELVANYREADVVVCPSRYEGFGLPVLEAMSLGIPVICSRIPPFEEVSSDGVFYFQPESAEDLAQQMKNVCRSRNELGGRIRRGREHAATFTWEQSVRRHEDVFQRISDGDLIG